MFSGAYPPEQRTPENFTGAFEDSPPCIARGTTTVDAPRAPAPWPWCILKAVVTADGGEFDPTFSYDGVSPGAPAVLVLYLQ